MIFRKHHKREGRTYYYVRYTTPDGKRRKEKAGPRRRDAERLLDRRLGEIARTVHDEVPWVDPRARSSSVSFRDFAARFLDAHPGRKRSDHYPDTVPRIVRFFGDKPLRSIGRRDIDGLRESLRVERIRGNRRRSPTTVLKYLRVAHRMFRIAYDWELISNNPCAHMTFPSPTKPQDRHLSPAEFRALHAGAPSWLRPILVFAVATGMRRGEVAALRWEHVDRTAGLVWVPTETKTGRRPVRLSEHASRVLCDIKRHVDGFVFHTAQGQPFDSESRRTALTRGTRLAAARVGVPNVTFHCLRHTFASWAVRAGTPLYEVQHLLGHSSPAMTQRYAVLRPGHGASATAAVDAALEWTGQVPQRVPQRATERGRTA